MRTLLRVGFIVAAAMFVTACGGSQGVVSVSPPPPPPLKSCNANPVSAVELGGPERLAHRPLARSRRDPYVPGLIVVKFSTDGAGPEIGRALARIHAQSLSAKNQFGYATYSIPQGTSPFVAATSIAATRGIAEAKPISARYLQVVPNDNFFGPPPPYTGPYTSQVEWDMYYTQMPAAWGITEGAAGVRIAVIDTGYDANNADICAKVADSAVFDKGTGSQDTAAIAQDYDGHGTAVSGIAAAVTNNETRYAGVGWNVDLLEVRVFQNPTSANPNPPGAASQDVAAAIDWALAHRANVINISLGGMPGMPCDSSEQTAIDNAINSNVAVVVASGNGGSNVLGDPANCNGVIVVGASVLNDTTNPSIPVERVAGYSSYVSNNSWGLVAPGGEADRAQQTCGTVPLCDFLQWIINNWSTTACCANSNPPDAAAPGVLIYGTSMAAPHVAGVAALMISRDPGIGPSQVASILKTTAENICGCVQQGAGRLNAASALAATP